MLETKRTPNLEQKRAIECLSGMTLSAGAGAGKTFVLVEHLLYRVDDLYLQKFENRWNDSKVKELQAQLLKIVMITFTRKASGELATRIRERVLEKIANRECDERITQREEYWKFWTAVETNLHLIFVSTIHSFCQKILNQKNVYIPIQEFQVVNDVVYRHKIKKLVEEFLRINGTHIPLRFLLFSRDVELAIQKIFTNVESRLKWANAQGEIDYQGLFDQMFCEMIESLHLGKVWDFVPVAVAESKKPKKWMEALVDYNRLCLKFENAEVWTFEMLEECLDTFKAFRKAKFDDANEEQSKIISRIYELKENKKLKIFLESTNSYLTNKEFIHGLFGFIRDTFKYVEENFYRDGVIAFNDLEYLIVKYIKSNEAKMAIANTYDLIIVDEFQDTSNVQFNILKIVTNNNFSKVVAVGDLKQAIYGFRGGEVGVFAETKKLVSENLNLSNNYRSEGAIIKFNNHLFEYLFPLGPGFEKSDRFGFSFEGQTVPDKNKKDEGHIVVQKSVLAYSRKIQVLDAQKEEARLIALKIEQLSLRPEIKSIAVLYRKLSGSSLLVEELQQRNLKYKAQTKILFKNEPAYLLTRTLVDFILVDREKNHYVEAVYRKMNEILHLFGLKKSKEELIVILSEFYANYTFFGIRFSLENTLFTLGISDSRHGEVWVKIISLIEVAAGSINKFDLVLRKMAEENSTTNLEANGSGPGVQIMTVHASKGLEFDAVFIAGIHNNGKAPNDSSKIGEEFLSLTWKLKKSDKKELKTPWMILENARQKELDFSESKRLFYVACTRARKELHFCDIYFEQEGFEKEFIYDKSSWINGLRSFIQTSPHASNIKIENIFSKEKIASSEKDLENSGSEFALDDDLSEASEGAQLEETELAESEDDDLSSAPPFHKSSLGVRIHERNEMLGVVGELSVTKLSEIAECPRKFYFGSVLKLKSDDLSIDVVANDDEVNYVPASSKERGTNLHESIFHHLCGKLQGKDVVPEVLWVSDEIKKLNKENAYLEKELKFSFFGQMISGTPDWFFVDASHSEVTIVDYKTGFLNAEKIVKYNAQIIIYAFGIKKLYSLPDSSTFYLKLFSIDERKIINTTMSGKDVVIAAKAIWQKTNQLNQSRLDHCHICHFQSYCQEKKN